MSGFEVLGLACAVFQTVSFAHEVFSTCKAFYDDKPPASLNELEHYASGMSNASSQMTEDFKNGPKTFGANYVVSKDLEAAVKRSGDVAGKLEVEVTEILSSRKAGSVGHSFRTFIKYKKRKSALKELGQSLSQCQRLVDALVSAENL